MFYPETFAGLIRSLIIRHLKQELFFWTAIAIDLCPGSRDRNPTSGVVLCLKTGEVVEETILRVDKIKQETSRLNAWESSFIYNIDLTLLRGIDLTTKQKILLNQIERKLEEEKPKRKPIPKTKKKEKIKPKKGPALSMFGPQNGTVFYSESLQPWDDSLSSEWE